MQWFDPLSRLVTSKADSFHINGVLWFFPCLIVISLAQIVFFSALKPIYSFVITSGVLVLMLLSNELISERWFWSIDSAVIGMFFYQLGVLVKRVNLLSYAVFNNEFKTYLILLFSAIKWPCRYKRVKVWCFPSFVPPNCLFRNIYIIFD